MLSSYDAWADEQATPSPFTIGGQTFVPRRRLPWRKYGQLFMRIQLTADSGELMALTEEFLLLTLKKEDRERFSALLAAEDDDDAVVSSAQINKLSEDLMNFYTGKVPPSDSSSPDGQPETGLPLRSVSLNPA
jgi:hypothetical protein